MLKWLVALFLLLSLHASHGSTTNYYVSPTGLTNNTGTLNSPWNLQTGLDHLYADTTIWLLSGTYPTNQTEYGGQSGHGGTATAPAIVQALTNYGPIIAFNGTIGIQNFGSDYTIYSGLTIKSNLLGDGIKIQSKNCTITNCIISWNGGSSSAGSGIAMNSSTSKSNKVVNCIIEYNGIVPAQASPLGHGIYMSHQGNYIDGCTIRSNWGYGIQLYSTTATDDTDNWIVNCLISGNTNAYGITLYNGADTGGAGTSLGTNFVLNSTIDDGMAISYGTACVTNCIILPSILKDPTRPVNTNSSRLVTKFLTDYCLGTNTIVGNTGGNNWITNLARSTLFPNLSSLGQYWLPTNSPARGRALSTQTTYHDYWGNWQNNKYDIGAFEYDMDLAADTRDLNASPEKRYLYLDHIPGHRRYEWASDRVGVPGGIPTTYTKFCDAGVNIPGTNIVVVADGVTDCAPAIQAAWNLCPTNQYVLLPSGLMLCNSALTLRGDYKILRGQGTNSALVVGFSNTAIPFINFGVYSEQGTLRTNIYNIPKGATNTVWDSVNNLGALFPSGTNGVMKLWQNDVSTNNGWAAAVNKDGSGDPVHYSPNASYKTNATAPLVRQMVRITGTNTGNQVYFWPPAMFDFVGGKATSQYLYLESLNFSGIENLSINCNDKCSVGIQMSQGMGSWIKNVDCYKPHNYHIYVQYSLLGEITGCYLHEAAAYGPSQGVGVILYSHVTGFNIYNNVFDYSYPGIETDLGVSGCVIAYNYFKHPQGGLANIDCHGPHSANMLVEGNIGYGVLLDGYFGSAEKWTIYRNWLHGNETSFGARKVVNIDHFSRNINIVNNFIGNPYTNWVSEIQTNGWNNAWMANYRFGYPNMGNDTYTGTNTSIQATNYAWMDFYAKTSSWIHANVEYGLIGTSVTNYLSQVTNRIFRNSYYADWAQESAPLWYTNGTWPPIGVNAIGQTNLHNAGNSFEAQFVGTGQTAGRVYGGFWKFIFGF